MIRSGTNGWLRPIDIWRCAIVKRPADTVSRCEITPENLVWLPASRPFSFRADPFGLWRDHKLHIFVEAFDYRSKIGRIELLVYDENFRLIDNRIVLAEPWHLSYPFVLEADGETWMLPEARRSGELSLYRARSFPHDWEAVCKIEVNRLAIDATPVHFQGKWWLFYALMRHGPDRHSELHVAWGDSLIGPWRQHPGNPVRLGAESTRPAGTPLIHPEGIDLPVQDCSRTYGGAIRRLSITRLDERNFEASDAPWLEPMTSLAPYTDGIHTIASAGPVTLIDCKRVDQTAAANVARILGLVRQRLRS
jgi:hypothetical protein